VPAVVSSSSPDRFRTYALWAILAAFAFTELQIFRLAALQPFGVDYAPLWAGVKALEVGRPYDFAYVTSLQGWPFGPDNLRPYIYPPTALFVFTPFAALPYWVGLAAWVAATYAVLAWAGRRMGAPWWMILFPPAAMIAYCGQATFLVGGLVAGALTLRSRPLVAGALFGIAAAIKPQMLLLLLLALLADRQWRTILAVALTGAVLCLASAVVWGVGYWRMWVEAMPRFHSEVILANPELMADTITPYAMLVQNGLPGAWAFLLAPVAMALVWLTFRGTAEVADRLIVLFAAALMVSPYAMHYEAALLLPAVAVYMARTGDRLWPLYVATACLYAAAPRYGFSPVAAALLLPLSGWLRTLALAPPAQRLT